MGERHPSRPAARQSASLNRLNDGHGSATDDVDGADGSASLSVSLVEVLLLFMSALEFV